jgi:hypothetical protein
VSDSFRATLGPFLRSDIEFPERLVFVLTSRIDKSPEVSLRKIMIASALQRAHDIGLR